MKAKRKKKEDFEERMARRGEHAGRTFARLAERMDEGMTRAGERIREGHSAKFREGLHVRESGGEWAAWHGETLWMFPFGVAATIVGSVLAVFGLFFGAWLLSLTGNPFLVAISAFLTAYFPWFFTAFVVLGLADVACKLYPRMLWPIRPFLVATWITGAAWVAAKVLSISAAYSSPAFPTYLAGFLGANLPAIFALFLALGFITSFISLNARGN
jgi:hypothetical protein